MRACPTCSRSYPDTQTFCTDDGTPLSGVAMTQEGPAPAPTTPGAEGVPLHLPSQPTAAGGPVTNADGGPALGAATAPQAQAFAEPQLIELGPGTQVGEYVVEKQIGEGGMGVIFSARHPIIGKRVALKVLNPDMAANVSIVQRFIQEARSVNQIGHRNIVDIFSFGRLPDGRHYFVMEFLEGAPFTSRIREPLEWPEAVSIWTQMLSAVEAAHARGIVHRDLKPDNVFLSPSPEGPFVKVLDFGIAKLMAPDGGVTKTSTGVPMGTPLYMSPEQTRGEAVDHRTDIYALGCILYETIVGATPFQGQTFFEVMSKQLTEPPPPFGDRAQVDPGLEQLVWQCLEKEAAARPQTVTEIRERIAGLRDAAMRAGQALFVRAGQTWDPEQALATQADPRTSAGTPVRARSRDASHTVPDAREPEAAAPAAKGRGPLPLVIGLGALVAVGVGVVALKPAPPPPPVAQVAPPPPVQPATPTPPAATEGKIRLLSSVSGLTVFLDDKRVAEGGPIIQLTASPGRHELKVSRTGYLTYSTSLIVAAGETTDQVVTLEPEKATGAAKSAGGGKAKPAAPAAPTGPKKPLGRDDTINPFGN